MSDKRQGKCLICESKATIDFNSELNETTVCCPVCGKYKYNAEFGNAFVSKKIKDGDSIDTAIFRSSIFYYLRVVKENHKKNLDKPIYLVLKRARVRNHVTVDEVLSYYPKNLTRKVDMILQLLNTVITDLGEVFIKYQGQANMAERNLYFMPSTDDTMKRALYVRGILDFLVEQDYLRLIETIAGESKYTFTGKTWERIATLRTDKTLSSKVFLAISSEEREDLIEAEKIFKKVIKKNGFIPVIIKENDSMNFILTDIMKEINEARFVIADLTGRREGVLFELGYAMAMKKPIIVTCNVKDYDKKGFASMQFNKIKWSTESKKHLKDFEDQLMRNIYFDLDKD